MPDFTGLWIYLGNFTGIPISTSSYPTTAQAESLQGFVSSAFQNPPYATTNTDLALTEVTWTANSSNRAIVNNASGETSVGTYDLGGGTVSSEMNYTANYRVEFILSDGSIIEDGVSVVQYEDGSLFIRPSSTLGTDLLQLPSAISGVRIVDHVPTSAGETGFAAFVGPRTFEGTDGEVPPVVCFTRGTLILTGDGEVPVEELRVGMLIQTLDHGLQPIRWIGSRRLAENDLRLRPHLRPVRIGAGTLGNRQPTTDLVVSPQHRLLVSSDIANRMTGRRDALIAAKHLVGAAGITVVQAPHPVEYWHFLCDRHEVIWANGTGSETLFTGPMALMSISQEARAEILEIFPELRSGTPPQPARQILDGRLGRSLTRRHLKNARAFVAEVIE